jgi:hypothetical protein
MNIVSSTASFTRPNDTTAYASNDLVANSVTAGSVTPMSFVLPKGKGDGFKIVAAKVQKSGTTPTNANFHIRLYGSSPTVANGDNGAWSSNLSSYLAKIDVAIAEAFTDGCAIVDSLSESADIHFVTTGNTIYGLLVADAAYTPAAQEVFTVTLILDQG